MPVYEDIKSIKGIGEKTARLFNKLGVFTVDDLLRYYPRTYVQYPEITKLKDNCTDGAVIAVRLFVTEDFKFKQLKNINIGSGRASDGEDIAYITFFNTPYHRAKLVYGASYIFYGHLKIENGRYKLEQPFFYTEAEYQGLKTSLQPVYSLTKGLSNKTVLKSVKSCIENECYTELYDEYLPDVIKEDFELKDRKKAIEGMHFPESTDDYMLSRKRLVFDELFSFLYMLKSIKGDEKRPRTEFKMIESAGPKMLGEKLPYKLTGAQLKAFSDITEDMTSGYAMNRLIQGDVGSGKTIVAFLALLMCVENGYQGAMMAPTEILAQQHYENICALTEKYDLPFKSALLTGHTTVKNKRLIYERLLSGEINVVIGTHAIIQDKVAFRQLALVITDEQHRFGVKQRENLSGKGSMPHILVMSATPIPRTLAIVIYGDLDISVMDEKPSSRVPIKNCVVGTSYRNTAYKFMADEIKKGHQVYIICPMVEASEELSEVCDVTGYTKRLREIFPESIRIEALHGQMKADSKRNIMEGFVKHDIDILVSTTVVEVGVDVPNATVMMIENAERFGLSALHQLRGRIGRGKAQSYCIFINGNDSNEHNKRLDVLNRSNDGFYIAKEDLKLRGAGDIFGIRQSGELEFELADIYEDSELILKINETIEKTENKEIVLSKEEDRTLKNYLAENTHKFIDFRTI